MKLPNIQRSGLILVSIFIFIIFIFTTGNSFTRSVGAFNACDADINHSGLVDLSDYSTFVQNYAKPTVSNPYTDLDKNSVVDLQDFSLLATYFFQVCQPDFAVFPTLTALGPEAEILVNDTEAAPASNNTNQGGSSSAASSSNSSYSSPLLPSQILNLTNWKVQLPTGTNGVSAEIKQPALATFQQSPWFVASQTGNSVRFRAAVNGALTSGTSYPRSELREMTNNGATMANWSSSSGIHTFYFEESITAIPTTKKSVVAGQILGATTNVIAIRLDYPKLLIKVGSDNGPTLEPNYVLGTKFSIKFVVSNDQTFIYYNGSTSPVYTLNSAYNGYFKVGAYVISNCTTEVSPELCNDNNYGEVQVYKTEVTHQ